MGWFRDNLPGHEGFIVGLVELEGATPGSGLLRELHLYDTQRARDAGGQLSVRMIAAACDCGWRSPRWLPDEGTHWSPSCVFASDLDEDRAYNLWVDHACAVENRRHQSGTYREKSS